MDCSQCEHTQAVNDTSNGTWNQSEEEIFKAGDVTTEEDVMVERTAVDDIMDGHNTVTGRDIKMDEDIMTEQVMEKISKFSIPPFSTETPDTVTSQYPDLHPPLVNLQCDGCYR